MTISLGWTWTDERVAELRRLSGLGYSNQQICEAMRAPSRNTIIGKCTRLRLTNNRKRGELAATPVDSKPRPARPAPWAAGQAALRPKPRFIPRQLAPHLRPEPLPLPAAEPKGNYAVTIFDLRPKSKNMADITTCRWPLWKHDATNLNVDKKFYCGAASGAAVYCDRHARKAAP